MSNKHYRAIYRVAQLFLAFDIWILNILRYRCEFYFLFLKKLCDVITAMYVLSDLAFRHFVLKFINRFFNIYDKINYGILEKLKVASFTFET